MDTEIRINEPKRKDFYSCTAISAAGNETVMVKYLRREGDSNYIVKSMTGKFRAVLVSSPDEFPEFAYDVTDDALK